MNLYAKAYWSNNPIPVNQQINNPDFIINVPIGVIVGSSDVTKLYVDQKDAALSAQIDTKLDASDYVQHFRGVFVSLVALQAAIPAGINGDYAHIDLGVGFDRKVAIWDTDDNKWIESTGSVALTTDEVTEGNTNKYFTNLRVRNTVLSGLVKTNSSNVTNTDTIEVAVGKLAAKSEAGGAVITWVDANTLTGYTKSNNLTAATTKVQFAKINGFIWMRGYITTSNTINAGIALFSFTDSRFLWDNTYLGAFPDNQYAYENIVHKNIKIQEFVEFRLAAKQIGTGTTGNITHRLYINADANMTSAVSLAVIEPVCIGIAKNP